MAKDNEKQSENTEPSLEELHEEVKSLTKELKEVKQERDTLSKEKEMKPVQEPFRESLERVESMIEKLPLSQIIEKRVIEEEEGGKMWLTTFKRGSSNLTLAARPESYFFEVQFQYDLVSRAEWAVSTREASNSDNTPEDVDVTEDRQITELSEHRTFDTADMAVQAVAEYMLTSPCSIRISRIGEGGDIKAVNVTLPIYPYSDGFSIEELDSTVRSVESSGHEIISVLGEVYDFDGMATPGIRQDDLRYLS